MIGSLHLADTGVRATVASLRRTPSPGGTPGLRHARVVVAAPLGSGPPRPQAGRVGLVAFWDDEAALDRFLDCDPLADALADGWSVRLRPVRAVPVASGHFPGIPDDLPTRSGHGDTRTDGGDQPTAVLTIGRVRVTRIVPFLRTSSRAEAQVADSPGSLWATGLANVTQRIVSTFSLWRSVAAMRDYATATSGHSGAIGAEHRASFHHVGSFVRFEPYAARGALSGKNPLPGDVAELINADTG
jgi:hypothetical protein